MSPFRNVVVGIDLANADRLASDAQLAPASRTARDKAIAIARRSGAALHLLAALDIDPYAEAVVQRATGAGSPSILERAKDFLAAAAGPAAVSTGHVGKAIPAFSTSASPAQSGLASRKIKPLARLIFERSILGLRSRLFGNSLLPEYFLVLRVGQRALPRDQAALDQFAGHPAVRRGACEHLRPAGLAGERRA